MMARRYTVKWKRPDGSIGDLALEKLFFFRRTAISYAYDLNQIDLGYPFDIVSSIAVPWDLKFDKPARL